MNSVETRILIADDDRDILNFLTYNLEKENYWVYAATNGKDALKIALKINPQLIVLDVMMPEMDGIETCRAMRTFPLLRKTPIAFLSALSEQQSEAACLEAGANDYIAKPIRPKLLMNRLQKLLQLDEQQNGTGIYKVGALEVNREQYAVVCDKRKIDLPRKEFEILSLLTSKPGRVYSREEIKALVWENNSTSDERTVDVHVSLLRNKIGEHYIKTIKGVGYKIDY